MHRLLTLMLIVGLSAAVGAGPAAAALKTKTTRFELDLKRLGEADPPLQAAVVLHPLSGRVLWSYHATKRLPIASLVKMMVALIVVEKIHAGKLSWDDPVKISRRAAKMGGRQVFLRPGEVFSVRDLFGAMMIHSANDAAVALAEKTAGTVANFVKLMNARARALGLTRTEYHNVHGLPPGRDQRPDLSCALDQARLAARLVRHPEIIAVTRLKTAGFRQKTFTLKNPNKLLYRYPGADGLKTGYHRSAKFCLAGTAVRGGRRLVVVVLGSINRWKRFRQAGWLLNLGFRKLATAKGGPARALFLKKRLVSD